MLLNGQVALITGASRGIGREIAISLARQGSSIIINYSNNEEAARETQREIEQIGYPSLRIQADVTIEEDVRTMVKSTVKQFGRIDVLVNNAGITRDNLLINMSVKEWDCVMATNLRGAFLCSKYVIRHMLRHHYGKIINISSISGVLGNAGQANYAASKAGLVGLTKTIAQEYSSKGITANVIAPGIINTSMTRKVSESVLEKKLSQILLKREGSPTEVASIAVFLASHLGDYVNGELIRVDGGIRF